MGNMIIGEHHIYIYIIPMVFFQGTTGKNRGRSTLFYASNYGIGEAGFWWFVAVNDWMMVNDGDIIMVNPDVMMESVKIWGGNEKCVWLKIGVPPIAGEQLEGWFHGKSYKHLWNMEGLYCGWKKSCSSYNRWFIPVQSQYLPCFIVTVINWCRISSTV